MSTNKTSEAVKQLFTRERPSLMELSAFQEKYLRMEQALHSIKTGDVHNPHDHADFVRCFQDMATEALDFDPLSS